MQRKGILTAVITTPLVAAAVFLLAPRRILGFQGSCGYLYTFSCRDTKAVEIDPETGWGYCSSSAGHDCEEICKCWPKSFGDD
jgi:hypothetical protein